jgi:predicted O-methyltransferase YrrM
MSQPGGTSSRLMGISLNTQSLLKDLHVQSLKQEAALDSQQVASIRAHFSKNPEEAKNALDALMLDKFIALEEDKCHLVHTLLLATQATTVVEVGTSFGVSTIYLAAAVGFNASLRGPGSKGVVIGTEKEQSKAAIARSNWKRAGPDIESVINLLEGDLNDTLAGDLGLQNGRKVDFVLLDIWTYLAFPALNLLLPKLRPGAMIVADNTRLHEEGYKELLGVLRDPEGDFQSVVLPYQGGLEVSVYVPKNG